MWKVKQSCWWMSRLSNDMFSAGRHVPLYLFFCLVRYRVRAPVDADKSIMAHCFIIVKAQIRGILLGKVREALMGAKPHSLLC